MAAKFKYWMRARIRQVLKEAGEVRGDVPRVADFRKATEKTPHYLTIAREYGTWEEALKDAGFPAGSGKRGRRKGK